MTEIAAGSTEVRCAEVLEALMKDTKLSSDKSSDEILKTNEGKKHLKSRKLLKLREHAGNFIAHLLESCNYVFCAKHLKSLGFQKH